MCSYMLEVRKGVFAMADDELSTKSVGLSFGFKKVISESKVIKNKALANNDTEETATGADLITSVEGKEVKSIKPKEQQKELVIPLIQTNNWRQGTVGSAADREAVQQILEDAARANETWDSRNIEDNTLVVPLLMRNKVPDGFETDDKLDVSLRPNQTDAADYEKVPIESFGMAMLRGMGFKEGQGVGKNSKVVAPVHAVLRPKGMGLGADKRALADLEVKKTYGRKPGDAKAEDDELTYKKGAFGLVEKGVHKDLYGKVEGLDEDNARVMVKLTISGQTTTISQYAFKLVTKKDYETYSKYLNKAKTDRYKEQAKSEKATDSGSDRDRHRRTDSERDKEKSQLRHADDGDRYKDERSRHSDKERKRKHEQERENEKKKKHSTNGDTRQELWVQPQIRVRLIDKHYKKGKYYNCKLELIDVIDKYSCVCRTEDAKVLEDISQDMLETVIPRAENAHIIIVHGKDKGQLAQIVKKDKAKCRATVQLLRDRDCVLKLDYEHICEFTGDVDVAFDY